MAKQTKEPLTDEKIKADLKRKAKEGLGKVLFSFLQWFILFGLLSAILWFAVHFAALPTVPTVIVAVLLFLVPFPYPIYKIFQICADLQMIKNGDFLCKEDTLCRISEFEVIKNIYFWGGYYRYHRRVFYFSKAQRYVLSAVDGSVYEHSSCKDAFYVIYYPKRPHIPALCYSQKIYERK